MFADIMRAMEAAAGKDFDAASDSLIASVNNDEGFLDTLGQIETIPERIEHDSTLEKLFSKVSDAVLARAFREIGLKSTVLRERGDSADVFAESPIHSYTLVADAKAFRMSRTAKNQKDFKVAALSGWRKDYDYAVLCAPYFQYPAKSSQIYAQALDHNVCLLSWEHLLFLISNGIKESTDIDFSRLWNYPAKLARKTVVAEKKRCFMADMNEETISCACADRSAFDKAMEKQMTEIRKRAALEKDYWNSELKAVRGLSREEAIRELIKARKINEKIAQINVYAAGLEL